MMKIVSALAVALLFCISPALAQTKSVQQYGPVIAGDCTQWFSAGYVQDSGGTCGGSGTGSPGGSLNSVQTNAGSGNFGGILLGSGQILIGQSGASLAKTPTGDVTIAASGATTASSFNGGTAFGTAAGVNTGTSGATLGLLNSNLTFAGNNSFAGTLTFSGLTTGTQVSCLGLTSGNAVVPATGACGSGGSSAFSSLTGGTNTGAAMIVGTGASLAASGSGTIASTSVPAAGVASGALANGMTATTQTVGDNTTKIATDAFVLANAAGGALLAANNLSDVASVATSRANLGVDQGSQHGSAAVTLAVTDHYVTTCNNSDSGCSTGTWNAAATWTLPAISSVNNGDTIAIGDDAQIVTVSKTLLIRPNGASDTVNGSNFGGGGGVTLAAAGQSVTCKAKTSDNNWLCGVGVAPFTATANSFLTGVTAQGTFTQITITAALDAAFGSAQGDILYRGASGWVVLTPGTSGKFLETQGASANPIWGTASGGSGCTTSGSNGNVLTDNGSGGCASDTDANLSAGALTLGASATQGSIVLNGSSSGATTLVPSAAAGTTTATFPANTGTVAETNVAQTFSASQSFGEVHGTAYAPTLTSNNYTTAITDCGKTLLLPTGTTPTITLANVNPGTGECTIKMVQMTSGTSLYTIQAASGGTLVSANSYTHTAKQYATIVLTLIVPSGSAATWALSGEGS